jgi:hypothetical protein
MAIKAAAFNQGKFPTIAFVNLATASLGVDLGRLVSALDKQMRRDFVPIWGYPAKLYVTKKPKPDEWQMVFLDDADAANALGYHDITKDGQPVSKVFVKTTVAAGQKVSVTASHELLEMMIDPGAQLWAQNADGLFYAYEMCDAVEEEEYEIDGVAVSDFVHPSFFEPWHVAGSIQFDHLGKVSRPFQTLTKGYQIVSDGSSAHEIFGSRAKARHFRQVEIRKLHRSECRKEVMPPRGNTGESRDGAAANMPSTRHAAVLHHAGKFLMALADVVDPIPNDDDPFDLAPLSRRSTRGSMRSVRLSRGMIDPIPNDDDPFDLPPLAKRSTQGSMQSVRSTRGMIDPIPNDDDPFDLPRLRRR